MDTAQYRMPKPPRKYKTNKIPNKFEHVDGVTYIHIFQKSGRHHIFWMESILFHAWFGDCSFSVRPMTQKNPHDKFYCVVSRNGVQEYLHRMLMTLELWEAPEGYTVDHYPDRNPCNCLRSNLRVASPTQQLANRDMSAYHNKLAA